MTFILFKMNNILKFLLFVLFIDISFESKVSTIQKNSLKKEIQKLDTLVKKQNKPLKIIDITESFLKCLNKTSIIPNKLLRAISTQETITVTSDYEYIFPPYYDNTIRQAINNKIRECSNETILIKKRWDKFINKTTSCGNLSPTSVNCNLETCRECIFKAKITNGKHLFKMLHCNIKEKQCDSWVKNTINDLISSTESKLDEYNKIYDCIDHAKCGNDFPKRQKYN